MSAATHSSPLPVPGPDRREVLLNFCRVVLRSDDNHLQIAMQEYQQALLETRAQQLLRGHA